MSKENPEVTFGEASYRLHLLQRELDYHKAVREAANIGFADSMDIHYDGDGNGGMDIDSRGHVSIWAQRLSHASEAVSEVSAQVAHAAKTVADLTRGAPSDEPLS